MFDKHAPFFERALVEENFQTLPGGQFAFGVLSLDSTRTAAGACRVSMPLELV
jgi:hypothetical protein